MKIYNGWHFKIVSEGICMHSKEESFHFNLLRYVSAVFSLKVKYFQYEYKQLCMCSYEYIHGEIPI